MNSDEQRNAISRAGSDRPFPRIGKPVWAVQEVHPAAFRARQTAPAGQGWENRGNAGKRSSSTFSTAAGTSNRLNERNIKYGSTHLQIETPAQRQTGHWTVIPGAGETGR